MAEANGRLGDDRTRLVQLAEEVDAVEDELRAVEADLGTFQRFLDLIDQAHQAQFPLASVRVAVLQQATRKVTTVPFLLQALSCYGVLEQDDWRAELERGALEPDQVARVRRAVYEELLWLADDAINRNEDHRSGRKLSVQEAAQQCLAYLGKAETAAPATTGFYQLRARCRKALRKEGEAHKDEELARRTRATMALDHYLLGLAAFNAGSKAEGIKQFEAALRVEPNHYWSLFWLGGCMYDLSREKQDYVTAAAIFTGCILKRPDHAPAWLARAAVYLELDHLDKAIDDSCKAIELDPKYGYAWHVRGRVHGKLGQWHKAMADLSKALELDPMFAEAWYDRALTYERLSQADKAEADYRKAIRVQPDYPEAHVNLGMILQKQGNLDAAEAECRTALRLRGDLPEAHVGLGNVLLSRGEFGEAEAECREALRLRPNFPEAHVSLSHALNEQRKFVAAEAECRAALRLRPDYPEAHGNLGNALKGQGKFDAAVAALRELLRLRPDWPEAHFNLGNTLQVQGKYASAEAAHREALRLRPDWPTAYLGLGNALQGQRKYTLAEAANRDALRLRPDWPEAHCNLGHALRQQGRFAEAVVALRRGHELGSQQPGWRYPSADWLRRAEALVALDGKLSKVLQSKAQPADAAQHMGLAKLCQEYKKLYAAAARFYTEAFAAEPMLAGDLRTQDRYNAACAAALAGTSQGMDAAKLDDKERSRWRRQALDWLRADLKAWSQLLEKKPDKARAAVQKTLQHWQQDTDFAGVRDLEALSRLPADERKAWQQLWQDVQALRKRAAAGR